MDRQLSFASIVKSAVIAAGAVLLMAEGGHAADLALKAEPPAAPVSWTGCYVGGNAGVAWSDTDVKLVALGMGAFNLTQPGAANAAAFGGQVGCDYQIDSRWVVGLRGMWDRTDVKVNGANFLLAGAAGFSSAVTTKTSQFGTAVARVGYNLMPELMLYGLGGVAFATNNYSQTAAAGGGGGGTFVFNGSDSPTGYDAGVGMSLMLLPQWDVFVEYDYMGFGTRTVNLFGPIAVASNTVTQHIQTVQVGLDYRFTTLIGNRFGSR